MTTAPSESILAADIGNITTRAALFDIVHGSFRFVAAGEARSTVEPPFSYMGEGLRQALEHLKALTGRDFMDEGERLLMPARANGAGVDSFAVSASAGKPLRTVVVGLMPNLSLASAERVALSAQTAIADRFGLGDRRKYEKQIDDIINCKPELVIIAGGTDHGSQGAVLQMTDMVALACKRIREGTRPEILFVGNAALHDRVRDMFAGLCEVSTTENVRPGLDEENITPARRHLAYIYERARLSRLSGYAELAQWSGGGVTPNAVALGSLIRHISEAREGKALLGVDIGSVSTTLVASAGDDHTISVRSDLGVGHSAGMLLPSTASIARWVPDETNDDEVRNYLSNKSLTPATVPHELHELYLEHALARQCLHNALLSVHWPAKVKNASGFLPNFDTIIATGAVLSRAPKPGQAALILIDGLQPTGVTKLVLDWQSVLPMLGAAAALNPVAVVQVLAAGALLDMGTVVAVTGGRTGHLACRVKITMPSQTVQEEIEFGELRVFHLPPGESKAHIQPLGNYDVGAGRGAGKSLTLYESAVGLIIDARGRPISIPTGAARREAVGQWCAALGQYGL